MRDNFPYALSAAVDVTESVSRVDLSDEYNIRIILSFKKIFKKEN